MREIKIPEDLEVRPMRRGGANILDQRHALEDVAETVSSVGAAMDRREGECQPVSKQNEDRHREAAIDGTRHVGQLCPE